MCERFDRLDREAIGPEPRITVGKGTVDALVATVLCLRALSFLSPLLRSFVDPGPVSYTHLTLPTIYTA